MKKIIALLLVLSLFMSMGLTTFASSEGTLEGNGTAYDPYIIENPSDFSLITDMSAVYYIVNNIELTDYTPIGTESAPFTGKLIGRLNGTYEKPVITLNITSDSANQALVGHFSMGEIDNIIIDGNITGLSEVAGFVATSYGGTVKNCENRAKITATTKTEGDYYSAAGIVAQSLKNYERTDIINCVNKGEINTKSSETALNTKYSGGIAGNVVNFKITGCVNEGKIVSSGRYVGGIAGGGYTGTILQCANNGDATALYSGVAGICADAYCEIEESYNKAAITGSDYVAGIAAATGSSTVRIVDCYNAGPVTSTDGNASGINYNVGSASATTSITLRNCYDVGVITGKYAVATYYQTLKKSGTPAVSGIYYLDTLGTGSGAKGTQLTEEQMKDLSNFEGFSSDKWVIDNSNSYDYPQLKSILYKEVQEDSLEGLGTLSYPYIISKAEDFDLIKDMNAIYHITKNIELTDYTPIGTSSAPFTGKLIGRLNGTDEKPVITLNITSDSANQALVGYFSMGEIDNIIIDGNITGLSEVAGFVATSYGGTVKNCENRAKITATTTTAGDNYNAAGIVAQSLKNYERTDIINCVNKGEINTKSSETALNIKYGGGIAGYVTNFKITGCVNEGNIVSSGRYIGGIAGGGNTGTILQCANNGDVTALYSGVAGICADAYCEIEESYNKAAITGSDYVAGIAAATGSSTVRIVDCYNAGPVTSTDGNASGINYSVGSASATTSITLRNCYDVGVITGKYVVATYYQTLKKGGTPAVSGIYYLDTLGTGSGAKGTQLTEEQMKDLANFEGFSSDKWVIDSSKGYNYPQLVNNKHKAEKITVTVMFNEGGSIEYTGSEVEYGETFDIRVIPENGYIIESVKLNGIPVVADEKDIVNYRTPAIYEATVITVKFALYSETVEITTCPVTFTEAVNGMYSGYALATAKENIGDYARVEYGMLFTEEDVSVNSFDLGNTCVIKVKGTVAPNILGQYGIKFTGKKIIPGTYYVRPYAIYYNSGSDDTKYVYGSKLSFAIEE